MRLAAGLLAPGLVFVIGVLVLADARPALRGT
jgi:hypothetical protein